MSGFTLPTNAGYLTAYTVRGDVAFQRIKLLRHIFECFVKRSVFDLDRFLVLPLVNYRDWPVVLACVLDLLRWLIECAIHQVREGLHAGIFGVDPEGIAGSKCQGKTKKSHTLILPFDLNFAEMLYFVLEKPEVFREHF